LKALGIGALVVATEGISSLVNAEEKHSPKLSEEEQIEMFNRGNDSDYLKLCSFYNSEAAKSTDESQRTRNYSFAAIALAMRIKPEDAYSKANLNDMKQSLAAIKKTKVNLDSRTASLVLASRVAQVCGGFEYNPETEKRTFPSKTYELFIPDEVKEHLETVYHDNVDRKEDLTFAEYFPINIRVHESYLHTRINFEKDRLSALFFGDAPTWCRAMLVPGNIGYANGYEECKKLGWEVMK
jgi:hypothetical protein